MGKSPRMWIREFLLRKKASKSSLSKGKDTSKSANKGQVLVSSKAPASDLTVGPPLISPAAPEADVRIGAETEHGVTAKLLNKGFTLPSAEDEDNAKKAPNFGPEKNPERIMREKAATRAQAVFRGYLARRAFRTLKGIIRLQALIRGRLVRRQAIATLRCVQAILKLQALARGWKVRRSTIGIEVQNKCKLAKIQGTRPPDTSGICMSTPVEKLNENAFAQKLLASSSGALPLCLQYSPGEPNLAWEWLEQWTRSQFWESHSRYPTKHDKFPSATHEKSRRKRTCQKQSKANVEKGSIRSTLESDKQKRKPRKLSSHLVDTVLEHPRNEIEKTNGNLRKTANSTKGGAERFEVDNKKPKPSARKASCTAVPEVSEGGCNSSAEKMKDATMAVSKRSDVDAGLKEHGADDQVGALLEDTDFDLQLTKNPCEREDTYGTNKLLKPTDHYPGNENQSAHLRRASFPLTVEHDENQVPGTQKVPSYMVPTESAKAKLRGQGSPGFSHNGIENGANRRLSLPSSNSGKLNSMSPRAQNLVRGASKGIVRTDKSLSASRDGSVSDKVIKPEWRR